MGLRNHLFVFFAAVAVATPVCAETVPAPVDPLSSLQNAFGAIVGANFRVPDQIAAATAPGAAEALGRPLGGVLRTSLQIPGAAFAYLMVPLGGTGPSDGSVAPAATATQAAHRRSPKSRRVQPAL